MFLYIICVLVIVIALKLHQKFVQFNAHAKIIDQLPGPPKLPIIGNVHQLSQNPAEILDKLFEWWREYGNDKYRIWIGTQSTVMITNEKDLAAVLTSNRLIQKSDDYHLLHPWLGTGLLTSSGSKWHKHRKMITPTFHFKVLIGFLQIMNKNATKFIEKLRQISMNEKIFDIQDEISYLTLDVICETAMGVNVNAMDVRDSEFVEAVQYMCCSVLKRAYNPIKKNQFLFKFTREYRKYKNALRVLHDFTYDVIRKHRDRMNSENTSIVDESFSNVEKKQVFLDALLSAEIDNQPLSLQDIYEEVSTFIFEGHDTTASGIAFTIFLLSRHMGVQEKVFAEQKEIFGDDVKRDASYKEICEMKYLENVIKECQRLYPSVPTIARYVDSDFDMNGTILPKGTSIGLFIMGAGYNARNFPDPHKFNPDRFDSIEHDRFAYVPFSAGPRNCIGQKYAMLEMKTVISKIVRNFEILPPLDELISRDGYVTYFCGLSKEEQAKKSKSVYDPIFSTILILKSINGILIRLREREI